jgi:hypothetical protein
MRKLILAATAIAALAVPTIAAASPGSTGVSTNGTTNDGIGWCVSAGNYNYLNGANGVPVGTTGQNRSTLNATNGPGAVSSLIAQARIACPAAETPYAPPGQ